MILEVVIYNSFQPSCCTHLLQSNRFCRLPRISEKIKTACAETASVHSCRINSQQVLTMLLFRFTPCTSSSSGAQKMSMIQVPSAGAYCSVRVCIVYVSVAQTRCNHVGALVSACANTDDNICPQNSLQLSSARQSPTLIVNRWRRGGGGRRYVRCVV